MYQKLRLAMPADVPGFTIFKKQVITHAKAESMLLPTGLM